SMVSFKTLTMLTLAGSAAAHMRLSFPPPLKADNNPNTLEADPYLHYPYGCCGRKVPGRCNGHLDALNTDEGKPVVTWAPGQKVNFTLTGHKVEAGVDNVVGGTHYGGSCQVGFSVDGGKTFKTAATWQGNCPLRKGTIDPSTQHFDFTIPADIPTGERQIFVWNWVNREQEKFETCASVAIAGGDDRNSEKPPESSPAPSSPAQKPSNAPAPSSAPPPATSSHAEKLNVPHRRAESVSWSQRPDMLLDIDFAGAACKSKGNPSELEFPNPGPDVIKGDGEYKLAPPTC
ncbi:lytic polysaccharide monooxygenase, partial [Periconia macrospinosa]